MDYTVTDLSTSLGVEIIGPNELKLFKRQAGYIYITADEADALRLWLDDHVQTKNVLS